MHAWFAESSFVRTNTGQILVHNLLNMAATVKLPISPFISMYCTYFAGFNSKSFIVFNFVILENLIHIWLAVDCLVVMIKHELNEMHKTSQIPRNKICCNSFLTLFLISPSKEIQAMLLHVSFMMGNTCYSI